MNVLKNKIKLILCIVAVTCGIMLVGCKEAELVEVRIESVWTHEQYTESRMWGAALPHVIATRTDTGERVWIRFDTWGKPGDVILISERRIHR